MSVSQNSITNDDLYLLAKGDWNRSWEKMGAHKETRDGQEGYAFAVWAPEVKSVSVIGEFNEWNISANPLEETATGGVWCGFVPGAQEGQLYKYYVLCQDGTELYKADPYAFWSECPPGTASRLADLSRHVWKDGLWMGRRARTDHFKRPLNIYEVHLGAWKRHDDGLDGLGMGLGFTGTLVVMGSIRELLGAGTLFGMQIMPASVDPMTFFIMPPGGFFVFGVLMALVIWIEIKTDNRKQRSIGCEGCPSAAVCGGKCSENAQGGEA